MKFYSPLRYPGGKSKLVPFIKLLINKANRERSTYIEPFAGGAGVALALLLEGVVGKIVVNDYDKAIYSVWRAIKSEPLKLIRLIYDTPININEWHKQQEIYNCSHSYSVELAFAVLFLNRVNRSGIVTGGPIGGFAQGGNWKLDARYNKDVIVERINDISKRHKSIIVYNQDILHLIDKYMPRFNDNAFIYFDPPYYNKSSRLYKNSLSHSDHANIAERILKRVMSPWILTYDDVPEIQNLYHGIEIRRFDLNYSVANNKGKGSEIIMCSDVNLYPTETEMALANICLNLRQNRKI
jgi:DNA adenine methylase